MREFGLFFKLVLPLSVPILAGMLPTILLYSFFQKYCMKGLTVGAVKG